MNGTIKTLNPKGFGFIKAPDGIEYFFHSSGVSHRGGFDQLSEGQDVEFDLDPVEKPGKGPRAMNVRRG